MDTSPNPKHLDIAYNAPSDYCESAAWLVPSRVKEWIEAQPIFAEPGDDEDDLGENVWGTITADGFLDAQSL